MMDIIGKTKDNLNAQKDLKTICNRLALGGGTKIECYAQSGLYPDEGVEEEGLGNDESLSWREVGLDSKCVAGHSIASATGGLGVRSLADYVRAFSMKLWWLFRSKSSLWSEYLHGRYCRNLHPTIVPYNRNHSSIWHRLCRIRDVANLLSSGPWVKQARRIKLCGRGLVRGISRRNLHRKLFDKLHLGGNYLLMSGTVPCGQLFQFSCGGSIESKWTRECDKRDLVFHLNTQQNAAKYHGVPFSTDGIILEVQRHIRTLYAAQTLTSTQWKGDLHQAAVIGFIFRQQVPRAPSIVRWHAPSPSWFKLNTDGSSLGIQGIIRDSVGHVYLAYQFALGTGTSVLAELTVVWRGMELALTHGLAPLVVEVDATTVISLLKFRVSGSGREANGATDHLAKEAASLQLTRVFHHDDITGILRGILCLER
ncbi:UNVERIFIED_CONTAM: hypothetical protein Sangu_1176300 [Sesamum angustifolium]|uniref:RNase H type-1 domain-containing protein n=1 Tax=Sesamum angustifolium TaxID=2727405 RepID=A0AAW2NGT0_9LAMI